MATIALDALPVAALLLGPDGRVATANARKRRLFAADGIGLADAPAAELFPAEEGVLERLAAAAREATPLRLQSRRLKTCPSPPTPRSPPRRAASSCASFVRCAGGG